MEEEYYVYNVSYFHSCGNGASQLMLKSKINSITAFNSVRIDIEQRNNLKNVVIINFQLIGRTNTWGNDGNNCVTSTKTKLTYDEFVAELGNVMGITEHNLKAMYEAYIDDNATE